ncbi:S8 family serine peptidase [Streptomyces sp. NBC_01728]|uniref:S8 family serine peptidase n=1 Tax=unclassified Streptomyces TaxID=2593676 RepID=UPI002255EEDB|nr:MULTISPECIES: S8 family serine peptidase [unclassified Streptomyces]MCX4451794.1 S8 family serine peptidase [Streptomyces sp. NBC_01719]MCX4491154.1 S8 family serine peptidase [Streptomyces sp. NBC_01728]
MRRLPPSLRPVMPLLLTTVTALGVSAPSATAAGATVRLPVLKSQLADGAGCTGASSNVASAVPWEQQSLDLARTWQLGNGAGVTVAVVDTGVSQQAPALKGRITAADGAGTDCVGHGSFVAGLIAAAPAKGVRFAGVAQGARVLGVRGTDDRGKATAATVAAGIRAAVDAGVKVIEVSPALAQSSKALTSAVQHAADHDVLIVAAAVPDAPTAVKSSSAPPPQDYWPAAEAGVLSVLDVDVDGKRPDGAYTPRSAVLAAPGDGVVGTGPKGKGHFIGSGASLAAGYVAGTAALLRAAHRDLTAAEIVRRLTTTAYPADVPRLDPYAALTSVRDVSTGVTRAAAAEPVSLPSDEADARATRRAVLLAAGGGGIVLLVAWAAVVVPRGRARGWRPTRH